MADITTFTGLDKLNISGPEARTPQSITTAATFNQLDNSKSVAIISGSTAAIALNGILAGVDGQVIDVINLGTGVLTFTHQSGSASSADQITCLTGSSQATTGAGAGRLIYSTSASKWILVSIQT